MNTVVSPPGEVPDSRETGTRSLLIIDDHPVFRHGIRLLIGELPGIAVCGEGCGSLWKNGNAEAAIRIEHLWDELARTFNVDVLCPYALGGVQYEETSDVFRRLREEHTAAYCR